jgi:hypothetical protein
MLSTADKKPWRQDCTTNYCPVRKDVCVNKIKSQVIKSEIYHYIPFLITAVGRLLLCEAVVNGCGFVILLLHNIILSFGEWFL